MKRLTKKGIGGNEMIKWKIIYKLEDKETGEWEEVQQVYFGKQAAVKSYLNALSKYSISELKIFKNDKDYTEILNKFLYR